MKDQFNLKKFLTENKLTSTSSQLNEQEQEVLFDGKTGLHIGDVSDISVYSLEDSSTGDTFYYGILDSSGTKDIVTVDVSGEQQRPEDIMKTGVTSKDLATFIANDINNELEGTQQENRLTESSEVKNITVQNMVFKEGDNSERVIGYDFVRGAYVVLCDTVNFYTVEELKERFELSQEDVNTLETMFDF